MTTVRVNLGERSYDIRITTGDPAGVGDFARQRSAGTFALVACDENVVAHADAVAHFLKQAGFRTLTKVLPAGESTKSLDHAARLYDALAEQQADRKTLVVAVGGGVVGDLAGFVAATYNRGLALLMVPTTLRMGMAGLSPTFSS